MEDQNEANQPQNHAWNGRRDGGRRETGAPSPLIVLIKQIGVNQANVDGLPTYISSTAGGVQ
jgi:hypothetical protein